jgi:hypothetical protein
MATPTILTGAVNGPQTNVLGTQIIVKFSIPVTCSVPPAAAALNALVVTWPHANNTNYLQYVSGSGTDTLVFSVTIGTIAGTQPGLMMWVGPNSAIADAAVPADKLAPTLPIVIINNSQNGGAISVPLTAFNALHMKSDSPQLDGFYNATGLISYEWWDGAVWTSVVIGYNNGATINGIHPNAKKIRRKFTKAGVDCYSNEVTIASFTAKLSPETISAISDAVATKFGDTNTVRISENKQLIIAYVKGGYPNLYAVFSKSADDDFMIFSRADEGWVISSNVIGQPVLDYAFPCGAYGRSLAVCEHYFAGTQFTDLSVLGDLSEPIRFEFYADTIDAATTAKPTNMVASGWLKFVVENGVLTFEPAFDIAPPSIPAPLAPLQIIDNGNKLSVIIPNGIVQLNAVLTRRAEGGFEFLSYGDGDWIGFQQNIIYPLSDSSIACVGEQKSITHSEYILLSNMFDLSYFPNGLSEPILIQFYSDQPPSIGDFKDVVASGWVQMRKTGTVLTFEPAFETPLDVPTTEEIATAVAPAVWGHEDRTLKAQPGYLTCRHGL